MYLKIVVNLFKIVFFFNEVFEKFNAVFLSSNKSLAEQMQLLKTKHTPFYRTERFT